MSKIQGIAKRPGAAPGGRGGSLSEGLSKAELIAMIKEM